jgi:hypothetical protein
MLHGDDAKLCRGARKRRNCGGVYQVQTKAAETFTAFDAIFAMAIFYGLLVEAVSRFGSRVETRVTAFLAHEARA